MKEAEKTVSEPAPESSTEPEPEIAEVAKKDSLQEAVDKVQASKEGHIGSLDGGDQEGAGMHHPLLFACFFRVLMMQQLLCQSRLLKSRH